MQALFIKLIGPMVIRAISSSAAKAVAVQVVRFAFDRAEARLIARGMRPAAELLQQVENELFDDPTPLVAAVEAGLAENPPVLSRAVANG